jgi:hypothetical protein
VNHGLRVFLERVVQMSRAAAVTGRRCVLRAVLGAVVGCSIPAATAGCSTGNGPGAPAIETGGGDMTAIAFNNAGTVIYAGDDTGILSAWDVASRRQMFQRARDPARPRSVSKIAVCRQTGQVAVADHRLSIIDSSTGADTDVLWDLSADAGATAGQSAWDVVVEAEFVSVGVLAAGTSPGEVRLWALDSRKPLASLTDGVRFGRLQALAASGDGRWLAGSFVPDSPGLGTGAAVVWDVRTLRMVGVVTGAEGALSFDRHGNLVAASRSGFLRWSPIDRQQLATIATADYRLATSPVDDLMATGNGHSAVTIDLWNTGTSKVVKSASAEDTVRSLAFHPKGTVLASGSSSGIIQTWQVPTLG